MKNQRKEIRGKRRESSKLRRLQEKHENVLSLFKLPYDAYVMFEVMMVGTVGFEPTTSCV